MKAPKIQRIGKKIPKKNIHPCRFLSVISPSVNATMKYKIPPPIPIPHHTTNLLFSSAAYLSRLEAWHRAGAVPSPGEDEAAAAASIRSG